MKHNPYMIDYIEHPLDTHEGKKVEVIEKIKQREEGRNVESQYVERTKKEKPAVVHPRFTPHSPPDFDTPSAFAPSFDSVARVPGSFLSRNRIPWSCGPCTPSLP